MQRLGAVLFSLTPQVHSEEALSGLHLFTTTSLEQFSLSSLESQALEIDSKRFFLLAKWILSHDLNEIALACQEI